MCKDGAVIALFEFQIQKCAGDHAGRLIVKAQEVVVHLPGHLGMRSGAAAIDDGQELQASSLFAGELHC